MQLIEDADESGILLAKSVTMALLFICSMLLGLTPLFIWKLFSWQLKPNRQQFVHSVLCFGAGVLLSTTFLHLVPEVRSKVDNLQLVWAQRLHLTELLLCLGFFLIYLIELLVHSTISSSGLQPGNGSHCHTMPAVHGNGSQAITVKNNDTTLEMTQTNAHYSSPDAAVTPTLEVPSTSAMRGIMIVLALSIHELFEGIAVGLETTKTNVWFMFGAIAAHKFVISFCIGTELLISGLNLRMILVNVFVFAIMSALGIAVGTFFIHQNGLLNAMPSVVLQGLASGTLIYIVFFEILDTNHKRHNLSQFFGLLAGFCAMMFFNLLEN